MVDRPLILISNDDGVHAPGVRALYEVLQPHGECVVVAPHVERSGSGQALTLHQPIRVQTLAENWHAVEGTPADCVLFALRSVLPRRPDYVFSGVNRGPNLGQDTLYSGTVAAAMEGCLQNIPAVALSLCTHDAYELSDYAGAARVVDSLIGAKNLLNLATGRVLNVNVPAVAPAELKGFKVATLGRRVYDTSFKRQVDPRGRPYYWLGGGGLEVEPIPGSDGVAVQGGYVSLTALRPDHYDQPKNVELQGEVESLTISPTD